MFGFQSFSLEIISMDSSLLAARIKRFVCTRGRSGRAYVMCTCVRDVCVWCTCPCTERARERERVAHTTHTLLSGTWATMLCPPNVYVASRCSGRYRTEKRTSAGHSKPGEKREAHTHREGRGEIETERERGRETQVHTLLSGTWATTLCPPNVYVASRCSGKHRTEKWTSAGYSKPQEMRDAHTHIEGGGEIETDRERERDASTHPSFGHMGYHALPAERVRSQ